MPPVWRLTDTTVVLEQKLNMACKHDSSQSSICSGNVQRQHTSAMKLFLSSTALSSADEQATRVKMVDLAPHWNPWHMIHQ